MNYSAHNYTYQQKQDLHNLEGPSLRDSLQEDDICQHDLVLLPDVMVTSSTVIKNVSQLKLIVINICFLCLYYFYVLFLHLLN